MTQDNGIRDGKSRLREAAVGVLQAAPEAGDLPEGLRTSLRDLHTAVAGGGPHAPGRAEGAPDPFEYALAALRYTDRRADPIPLRERASDLRERLAEDRSAGEGPSGGRGDVVVTELRAMVIAGLLEELAARLAPGAAFGPGRSGEDLARLATELAEELLDQTFVGR